MDKYYLAGPMSFIPQFNFPLFDSVAAKLREAGHTIVSPAELDDERTREIAMASPDGEPDHYEQKGGWTWGDLLARDVKVVADEVDGIVVLPGWSRSRGARLECYVAMLCNKPVFSFDRNYALNPIPTYELKDRLV
jgi:hypothetical protein